MLYKAPAGVWGAVLAAGLANRYGGGKQIALFQGRELVTWPVIAALNAGLERVLVILGANATVIATILPYSLRLQLVFNSAYILGIGSSLALAAHLALNNSKVRALVVLLGDQPFVQPKGIVEVAEACLAVSSGVAQAIAGDLQTHPVAFTRRHLIELSKLYSDQGGRKIIQYYGEKVFLTKVPLLSALDIDYPEDLIRVERLALSKSFIL